MPSLLAEDALPVPPSAAAKVELQRDDRHQPDRLMFAAAVAILVVAWLFQLSLLAYAMYALLAILVISRMLARSWTSSVAASRECNRDEVEVGDTVAVVVRVRNSGALPVAWLLMEDLLPRDALMHTPPKLKMSGQRLQLAMLAPGTTRSLLYQLTCNRRGYYQIGPLLLETGDLFGLHRRHQVAAAPHFVLVLPKVMPLEGYQVSSKRPIGEVRMTYRLYEDPTRIAGVRRYEQGDPMNRVHWRATARTGVLHSKVYEPSTVAGATLLLDFHAAAYDRRHEPFRSELAITAAASIANALTTLGQQVGLATNGRDAADRIRTEGWGYDLKTRSAARKSASMQEKSERLRPVLVETRRSVDQLYRILQTLARLELTDGLSLRQLVEECESRLPRDATVIAILANPNVENVLTLASLKKRGFAVTAILNIYEEMDFADASIPLLAAGIETRHLKEEASISDICRQLVLTGR
jgi:uncharacterized protein (DUF58 family)